MTTEVREMVIDQACLNIVQGQVAKTIDTEAISDLRYAMLVEAGLRGE